MKTFLLTLCILFAVAIQGYSQSPALVAKFGIDGELSNDTLRIGAGTPAGSHDWFKQKAGTGIGLVDTAGTSVYKPMIAAGGNVIFTRGQSISRYAIVDNMYMLDTRYGRDGLGSSGPMVDSTVFKNSNKNGGNPTNWGFEPTGGGVQNKNDIVDIYAHMRRNGTTINATNPSPLYLFAGASTLGVEGDRYIDFELYKSRVSFSRVTGFSNSGPSTTGGHSQWTFNADGTVKSTGDMMLSFSYSSSAISDVAVYIWVAKTTKNSINPFYFDFISDEYYGDGFNPDYGYCRITQNNGLPNFEFSATANTFNSNGPFWGTNSKDLGVIGSNYAAANYHNGQLSEVAINLTSLGIDPALGNAGTTTDPCAPPFTRLMVKTRASNSFTAELKDFTGPYPFLDAPQVPQQIKPANLTCVTNNITLEPLNPQAGAFYVWTTVGGTILTNPISSNITVSGEGKYYLTASIVSGCLGLTDSVILTRDTYQPVATARMIGATNAIDPSVFATLEGGDPVASNYFTHYGSSAGLSWEWSGPNGFTANTKDALTNVDGTYTLIVTELRNGCKDTAETQVLSLQTLPIKIAEFSATKKENEKVLLKWTVVQEEPGTIELMRSFNATDYTVIAMQLPVASMETLSYTDNVENRTGDKVFYKLKITNSSGKVSYSDILVVSYTADVNNVKLMPNPVNNYTLVSFSMEKEGSVQLLLVDLSGKTLLTKSIQADKGHNQVMLSDLGRLSKGIYVIRLQINNSIQVQKFIKQ
jgi:hypothetical protein